MATITRLIAALALLTLLAGCAQYDNQRGVDVSWQPAALDTLERGKTTRGEVLEILGPPSQIIALGDETVLYYLFERTEGNGLILVAYNRFVTRTHSDRAVFFFDGTERLSDYATYLKQ